MSFLERNSGLVLGPSLEQIDPGVPDIAVTARLADHLPGTHTRPETDFHDRAKSFTLDQTIDATIRGWPRKIRQTNIFQQIKDTQRRIPLRFRVPKRTFIYAEST